MERGERGAGPELGPSTGSGRTEGDGQAHPQPLPQAGGEEKEVHPRPLPLAGGEARAASLRSAGAPSVRLQPNKHREAQVARTGGRKLFNRARKKIFLEWFAATANLGWAAEKAEVCRQTVAKHLMSDPEFYAAYEDALKVSRLRLKAKLIETRKPEAPLAIDCDVEAPDIEIEFEKGLAMLREMDREVTLGRKRGRTPQIASNDEVTRQLSRRVIGLEKRVRRRRGAA